MPWLVRLKGQMREFDSDEASQLESAYQKWKKGEFVQDNKSYLIYKKRGHEYKVDFDWKKQINMKTSK